MFSQGVQQQQQGPMQVPARAQSQAASIRPGLYHIRLSGQRGAHSVSVGVVLQFKRSFGYFTVPGADREMIATPAGPVAGDGSVEVDVLEDGAWLRRRANPMPRQRSKDRFWSDVARMRNAGLPFQHLFGDLRDIVGSGPNGGLTAVFRPVHLQHIEVELEIMGVVWRKEDKQNNETGKSQQQQKQGGV